MKTDQTYLNLLEGIRQFSIIDTHEHLPGHENRRDQNGDLFTEFLNQYFNRDLVSAGCAEEVITRVKNKEGSVMDRWLKLEPYWEVSRHTGYGRALEHAAKDIYGVSGITRDTIEELYKRFEDGKQPGHFEYVLKEKSRIRISLLDGDQDCDRNLFRPVFRTEQFLFPEDDQDLINAVKEVGGTRAHSFSDWLDACDAAVDKAIKNGAVAYKIGMAYSRSLAIAQPRYQEAEDCFLGFKDALHHPDWLKRPLQRTRAFEDYMLHHVLKRLTRHDIPVQIHTGLQEGSGNEIRNSDPLLLSPTFLQYKDLDFVLMHIGYPWHIQLAALAKTFPNVYLDMCWAHIISPNASVAALDEWLDAVPFNKICAFGGDYGFVDGVYGHQILARENVARALTNKVNLGIFDEDKALHIARRLFIDNPHHIFRLGQHGVSLID